MKIKMNTLAAGPDGVKHPGRVYDVDAKEAKSLINGGYAVSMEPEKPADPLPPEVPEGLTAHRGGWYELPNGEKVQGLENAIQALADYRQAEQKAADNAEAQQQAAEAEALRKQQEAEEAAKNKETTDDE